MLSCIRGYTCFTHIYCLQELFLSFEKTFESVQMENEGFFHVKNVRFVLLRIDIGDAAVNRTLVHVLPISEEKLEH